MLDHTCDKILVSILGTTLKYTNELLFSLELLHIIRLGKKPIYSKDKRDGRIYTHQDKRSRR